MLQFIETDNAMVASLITQVLPVLIPFVLSLLIGPRLIAVLRAMKAGQPIREASKGVLAPEHQSKVGTPTMGGIMIISLILLSILLCADLTDPRIHCILLVTGITAFLGFLDDFAKITKKSTDGVSGWFKIGLQFLAAAACAAYLYWQVPGITGLYMRLESLSLHLHSIKTNVNQQLSALCGNQADCVQCIKYQTNLTVNRCIYLPLCWNNCNALSKHPLTKGRITYFLQFDSLALHGSSQYKSGRLFFLK